MAKSRQYTDGNITFRVPTGRCCPSSAKDILKGETVGLSEWAGKPLNGYTEQQLIDVGLSLYVAPTPAPQTLEEKRQFMVVSPWQIRKALNATGKRGQVNAAMAQADQDTQDGWEYATSFERLNPLVVGLGTALGLTETELDDLFTLAGSL